MPQFILLTPKNAYKLLLFICTPTIIYYTLSTHNCEVGMEVIPVCFKSHTLWYVNYLLQFYSLSSHFDIHDQAEKKQNNVVYKAINLNTELIQTILLKIF